VPQAAAYSTHYTNKSDLISHRLTQVGDAHDACL
jgi:hypothetical protein